jgi:hypothetical protein
MTAIQTNISVTTAQKEYYQKFVNLSVNTKALPQGDATMRISPFDDYFLFTVFDEIDGEDTPIDLSNVGNIFLSFISTSDEIVIKNHTQVAEANLSQGEVLFRITKSDSKKVLALKNNNFYISTKMISEDDDSISDESVLYQGVWLAFDAASKITLTSQIEEQRLEYSIELARLNTENATAAKDNSLLINTITKQDLALQAVMASNSEMTDEISELTRNVKSGKITALNKRAKEATALGREQLKSVQQLKASKNSSLQTGNNKAFYKTAAGNLQKFTL